MSLSRVTPGISDVMREYRTIENAFLTGMAIGDEDVMPALSSLVEKISAAGGGHRNCLIPDPAKGSACKRLNLFLRWMVRKDEGGVDFGIWTGINAADLYIPLDIHTGNVARQLGLLNRKQNDWKATEELTAVLRELDPDDPVRFDYALFGMGVSENKRDG